MGFPFIRVAIKCPVGCKDIIGYKEPSEPMILSCSECGFDFWYKANDKLPHKATKHIDNSKSECGCGRCGR